MEQLQIYMLVRVTVIEQNTETRTMQQKGTAIQNRITVKQHQKCKKCY